MLTLIKNEWIKLTKKRSTWIMLLLLVLMTFGLTYVVRLGSPEIGANDLFASLSDMTSFLNLFVVIVAASSVAEEFSRGTIKFLLIRPFSRSQILAAKAINTFLFALLGTAVLLISSLAAANLFLAAESPFAATGYNGLAAILVALVFAGTNLLLIVFYIALTLFISAVIRSQSLAVGLGLGNSPDMQMTAFDPGLGYWEMAIGILVYSVLIYLLTNWLFNKRDVALS